MMPATILQMLPHEQDELVRGPEEFLSQGPESPWR